MHDDYESPVPQRHQDRRGYRLLFAICLSPWLAVLLILVFRR
jgi:hypothetical protein